VNPVTLPLPTITYDEYIKTHTTYPLLPSLYLYSLMYYVYGLYQEVTGSWRDDERASISYLLYMSRQLAYLAR